jgi:hypothetical protein
MAAPSMAAAMSNQTVLTMGLPSEPGTTFCLLTSNF